MPHYPEFIQASATTHIRPEDISITLPNGITLPYGMFLQEIRYECSQFGQMTCSGSFIIPNMQAYLDNVNSNPESFKPAPEPVPERTRILDLD